MKCTSTLLSGRQRCRPWKINKGPFKDKKITFASQTKISKLGPYTQFVTDVIAKMTHIDCWISDESMLGDFPVEGKMRKLRKKLGVPIKSSDLIVDVAQRVKEQAK